MLLKLHFEWKVWPKDGQNQGFSFKNQDTFFRFLKREREASPLFLVAHLWVWMNIHQYPWICLNIFESGFVQSSYMFDRLLKMPRVLNKAEFWIWHGCIWKGYAEFQLCLIMAPYASIMPEYLSICLNIP